MTHHENALKISIIWMRGDAGCRWLTAQTFIAILEVIKGGGEAISVTVYSPKRKQRDCKERPLILEIIQKQIRKTSPGSMFNTEPKKMREEK